jgi:hypothetical protein
MPLPQLHPPYTCTFSLSLSILGWVCILGDVPSNFGLVFILIAASFSCVSVKSRKKTPWHLSHRQEMVMIFVDV